MSIVTLDNKTILVTGVAGFIGSNLVKRIYQEAPSATVIGIDNMNDYYDVALKEFRLNELAKYPTFAFVKGNIADNGAVREVQAIGGRQPCSTGWCALLHHQPGCLCGIQLGRLFQYPRSLPSL